MFEISFSGMAMAMAMAMAANPAHLQNRFLIYILPQSGSFVYTFPYFYALLRMFFSVVISGIMYEFV